MPTTLGRLPMGARFRFPQNDAELIVLFRTHNRMVIQDAYTGFTDTISLNGPMGHVSVHIC